MSSLDEVQIDRVEPAPRDKKKEKFLWKIALILGIVTAIEFLFAFTLPRGPLLITIFVTLTIVKAFYIVAEFMHLKYEVKVLIWSILIPMLFVVWLIIALLVEGGTVMQGLY